MKNNVVRVLHVQNEQTNKETFIRSILRLIITFDIVSVIVETKNLGYRKFG